MNISPRTWSPTHNTAETSQTKQKNGNVYSLTPTRVSRLYSSFLLTFLDDNVLEVLLADLPHTYQRKQSSFLDVTGLYFPVDDITE